MGQSVWQVGETLAAYAVFGGASRLREILYSPDRWGKREEFFGAAVRIAIGCLNLGDIGTYAAFEFIIVRIFGGKARPLAPALFAAAALHPEVESTLIHAHELEKAIFERRSGYGEHEPQWFPNHPLPAFVEVLPYPGTIGGSG